MGDAKSLAHTKWNCKYHIVFAPKYRRQVFYGEKRRAVGDILRKLCEWKDIKILEAECCPDHIHMLLEIPPKISVSSFMGYLKGKSSLMLYEQFGDLKFKYRSREFWCRGFYVDTVGKNTAKIQDWRIQLASATPSRLNEKARWYSTLASPSNQRLRGVWAMHTLPGKNGTTSARQ